MNDIETKLKAMLNEQVDAEVGRRRTPPPFPLPSAAERAERRWFGAGRGRPWALPLLAAACVAAIVGISVSASNLLADDKPTQPGNSLPVPTQRTTATEPNHLTYQEFVIGGATLAVPHGWTIKASTGDNEGEIWCLNPTASRPDACTIAFRTIVQPVPGSQDTYLDVDQKGLGISDPPQFCGSAARRYDEQTGDRTFGGRAADWRRWSGTCPGSGGFAIEQYVVATNPAYAVLAGPADAATHAAMTTIAEYSTLPRQSDPLRLMDRGILRSADPRTDGVTITIDRVVASLDGPANLNPATYRYLVPTAIYNQAHASVGDQLLLETDGVRVLKVSVEGG